MKTARKAGEISNRQFLTVCAEVLFNGRFKEENHSLFLDAQSLMELRAVVDERMEYYNIERRHSSIGYLSPLTYIECVRSGLAEEVHDKSEEASHQG